jgi:P27 family predicted phage terminase small subunit
MGGLGAGGARSGAGKKKKSAHLKIVNGTYRKDRENVDAPEPSKKLPVAPSHLNDRAVYYFNIILQRMDGRASETFTEVIALLAITSEEVEKYYGVITDTPFFVTVDSFGNQVLKPHPAAALYKEAKRHSHTLLMELGLTPGSIGRMNGGKAPKKIDPWEEL